MPDSAGVTPAFARGNYAANGGRGNAFSTGDYALKEARGPFSMGGPSSTLASIVDGTSNVIFVSKVVVANRNSDVRGAWAYPVGTYICGGSRFNNPPTPQEFLRPNGNALDDTMHNQSASAVRLGQQSGSALPSSNPNGSGLPNGS